tara:strand:+ start:112 stop:948 length:837 start_codon:yes stop_codon:yes gene_type:complete
METEIIAIYCWTCLILDTLGVKEDHRRVMTDSELVCTLIVASRFFSGNIEKARIFLLGHGYIPKMLSASRFNRRMHDFGVERFQDVQAIVGEIFKEINPYDEYAVDSFPVPCCDNIRIFRSQILKGEEYRGYTASKKRYFYGLKVHVIVTFNGYPVEFILTPGSWNDVKAFKSFNLDLSEGSVVYGDKAYNDYADEDLLMEAAKIELASQRKSNSKRHHSRCKEFVINTQRKMVETTFSKISGLLPKKIHAVTAAGFAIKVAAFLCATSFSSLTSVVT